MKVISGFITAKRGRTRSLPSPRFSPVSSSVSTDELLVSLPAAEIVSTTPTGAQPTGTASRVQNFQMSTPGLPSPSATALAVSMALPPPAASTKSAPNARARSSASRAKASRGLGLTPPSASWASPAAARLPVTRPISPLLTALPPP